MHVYIYLHTHTHVHIHVYVKLRIYTYKYFYLSIANRNLSKLPATVVLTCIYIIYIYDMIEYVFCIWMYLGFKHNMCLRGDIFSRFDFCFFLLDASFSEQVFFHCKGKQQFWGRKTESRNKSREDSKSRKLTSEKASLSISKSQKVEKSKKWNGVIFNFEKSNSWKVKICKKASFWISTNWKVEKSKVYFFTFHCLTFWNLPDVFPVEHCAALFFQLRLCTPCLYYEMGRIPPQCLDR